MRITEQGGEESERGDLCGSAAGLNTEKTVLTPGRAATLGDRRHLSGFEPIPTTTVGKGNDWLCRNGEFARNYSVKSLFMSA
jgi:hypothetical protein